MGAAIDLPNVASGSITTGLTLTVACTCSAAATFLLVATGNEAVAPPQPTGLTYNGVAMTLLGGKTDTAGGGIYNCALWYLLNPAVGTFNVVSTSTNSNVAGGLCAMPMTGVNNAITPIIGTGLTGNSAAASCSVSGGGANDLQVATAFCSNTTIAAAGAPQNNLLTLPIHAVTSFSADYITPGSPGNFAWALTSGVWTAIGATIFGSAGTPNPFYYQRKIHHYI